MADSKRAVEADDVLGALPEALLVVVGDRIEWANRPAREWLGREQVVGASLTDVLGAGEAVRLTTLLAHRAAGWEMPATFRLGFRGEDGGELVAEVRISDMPGGGCLLSARDVTDVKRAERLMGNLALFASDRPLLEGPQALLDASAPVFDALGWTVAFTELVPGGSITRRVLAPPDDPVGAYGRSIVDIQLPLERTPLVMQVLRRREPMFLDNTPLTETARELSRSMTQARVSRSAWCPIWHGTQISHILSCTGKDLTDHDFVAVQLFAAQLGASLRLSRLSTELVRQERLAAVGEMAAVLAHEVRTPVGVLFNALGLLRKTEDASERARLMTMLTEEAARLTQLVQDLLDFASPKSTVLIPVDLPSLVRSAVDVARLDPAFHDGAPDVQLELEGVTRPVRASVMLLRRALINLVVNALQHVPKGRAVRVSLVDGGTYARVRVFNEGTPIEPAVAARIFEPFFTTQARGTGLGLAIVRRIAVELGGRVELEPTPDGVTFVLDVDYADA